MNNFLSNRSKIATDNTPSGGTIKLSVDGKATVSQVVCADPGQAKVELISEKGVVQTIVITCKCGERMELKCHY